MLYIIPTVPSLPSRKVSGPGSSSFSRERSAHDRLSLWTEQEYGEIHSSVYRCCHRYRCFLDVGCGWGRLTWQREQGKLLEGHGARLRKHCNDAFLLFYYCYSQLLARAYLRNRMYVEDFEDTTEISKNRTSWPYKNLNFDKMRRKGGLSRDSHIWSGSERGRTTK